LRAFAWEKRGKWKVAQGMCSALESISKNIHVLLQSIKEKASNDNENSTQRSKFLLYGHYTLCRPQSYLNIKGLRKKVSKWKAIFSTE